MIVANPQKENGYVPIANEIAEALARVNLPSGEQQVLWVVLRKTYGFNKKADNIAFSQFVEMTGLSRRAVIYALQNLEAKRIVLISKSRNALLNNPNSYRFNKDYETWVVQNSAPSVEKNRKQAKVSSAKLRSSAKLGKKVVQNSVKKVNSFAPTKDTIQKTITKDKEKEPQAVLIVELIHSFEEINPSTKILYGHPPQRKAALRLIEKHGLDRAQRAVSYVLANRDDRYCPSITTPVQLEAKWAQLEDFGRKKSGRTKKVIM